MELERLIHSRLVNTLRGSLEHLAARFKNPTPHNPPKNIKEKVRILVGYIFRLQLKCIIFHFQH